MKNLWQLGSFLSKHDNNTSHILKPSLGLSVLAIEIVGLKSRHSPLKKQTLSTES